MEQPIQYEHPNVIVHTDALEYTDAFQRGVKMNPPELNQAMQKLERRMREVSGTVPTYLESAYRGYEAAWLFHSRADIPAIVRLNEVKPARVANA